MAGSHRAPRTRTQRKRSSSAVPRWALVAAVVVALVPAAYLTAHRAFHDSSAAPSEHSTDLPIPPVSPSATGTSTTPSPAPTRTVSPGPKQALPGIAPDAPRRITSGRTIDSGFDSSVTGLDASSDSEVARWDPRGSPGSPGTDTVYVLGRVRDGAAFARLGDLERGSRISIRTDRGTMTYTVTATTLHAESGLRQTDLFRSHHIGRLVLVGIRYDASGDRLDKALVVTAQLTAAKKA